MIARNSVRPCLGQRYSQVSETAKALVELAFKYKGDINEEVYCECYEETDKNGSVTSGK